MKTFAEFILEGIDDEFPRKKKIDPVTKRALTDYMGQGYMYARKKSREHIDKLIRTSPWTSKEQTIYRGVTKLPDTDKDGHHTHPSITSYSRSANIAGSFTGAHPSVKDSKAAIIRLKVPPKTRMYRTDENDDGEKEQLLRAGSKIKINREPSGHHIHTGHTRSYDHKKGEFVNTPYSVKVPIHDAELIDDNTSKKGK